MTLDVRTKLCLLILANACFFFRIEGGLSYLVVAVFLGILAALRKYQLALILAASYLALVLLSLLGLDRMPYHAFRLVAFAALAGQLIFPSLVAALILIKTTTVYELVHGLRKWRLPEVILLTFAVMIRFLPSIKEESRIIQRSLKVRGIFISKWQILSHPSRYLEYLLVPLLLSLLRNSQQLTIASLTKGLAIQKEASECFVSNLTWKDWGIQLWALMTILYMMLA
ncbi:energy-coupling factor transporter transmembrane component T [Streptococcus ictaluri]|uniref:Cobalt transport protein n=1 Tax=Streptococcus ictaluri 707-05 TaxID=764299 RepID=G5JZZ1_9STRE|nr:energy-coupling factor transporter transmembrane component T [Streptococcus ictaluri]EHI70750.1 cobalt transport protein [Streptococcus ictaluri 707-05]